MKKFCLLLVLSSILLLTSCSLGGGHMPGSIFDDDKTAANTRIEKLLEAIQSKNGDIVKSMFSKNAIADANNIDENIFKLFNCFKGEILSYEDWGGPGVSQGNNDDGSGRIWKILRSTYDVKTSENTYRFAIKEFTTDTADPNNVGVYSIYVINAKDTDMDVAYWGDGNWTPGLTVVS